MLAGLLGAAYLIVEVALVQRVMLICSHPAEALVVVLSALLLASGLGASWIMQLEPHRLANAAARAALVAGMLLLGYALLLSPLARIVAGWERPARLAVAACLAALPGVAMGCPLPALLRALAGNPERIAWCWAAGGACGVAGTTAATLLALGSGFSMTLATGGLLYLIAAFVAWRVVTMAKP
jgi:hypothetical protein